MGWHRALRPVRPRARALAVETHARGDRMSAKGRSRARIAAKREARSLVQ
jgi:hypothetical protein